MASLYAVLPALVGFLSMALPLLFISNALKKVLYCKGCEYNKITRNVLTLSFTGVAAYSLIMLYDLYFFGDTVLIHRLVGFIMLFFAYSTSLVSLYYCNIHLRKGGR